MAELAVVNSSPLIHLSRAGLLSFLDLAARKIVVPSAVLAEVEVGTLREASLRAAIPSFELRPEIELPHAISEWDLGKGETAVLAWAHRERTGVAVIDDRQARRCAAALGITVIGTLGLVLLARQEGRIPRARPVVEELVERGMYLSPTVVRTALALVGE